MAGNDSFVCPADGFLSLEVLPQPPRGQQIIWLNDFNPPSRVNLLALHFDFWTGFWGPARRVHLRLIDNIGTVATLSVGTFQQAGLLFHWVWAPFVNDVPARTGSFVQCNWPSVPIDAGYTLTTVTENMWHDTFRDPILYLRRWRT